MQTQMKEEVLAVLCRQQQHPLSNSKEDCAAEFNAYVDKDYIKKILKTSERRSLRYSKFTNHVFDVINVICPCVFGIVSN